MVLQLTVSLTYGFKILPTILISMAQGAKECSAASRIEASISGRSFKVLGAKTAGFLIKTMPHLKIIGLEACNKSIFKKFTIVSRCTVLQCR